MLSNQTITRGWKVWWCGSVRGGRIGRFQPLSQFESSSETRREWTKRRERSGVESEAPRRKSNPLRSKNNNFEIVVRGRVFVASWKNFEEKEREGGRKGNIIYIVSLSNLFTTLFLSSEIKIFENIGNTFSRLYISAGNDSRMLIDLGDK